MEEIKNSQATENVANERVYTQDEVANIISRYNGALEQLKATAQNEINKRDLSNFYQTLSVLFEVVKERDAYSKEFVSKVISLIENSISESITERKNSEDNKDEQQIR